MTLTLDLPPEVEGALAEAARQQGTTPERVAINRSILWIKESYKSRRRPWSTCARLWTVIGPANEAVLAKAFYAAAG